MPDISMKDKKIPSKTMALYRAHAREEPIPLTAKSSKQATVVSNQKQFPSKRNVIISPPDTPDKQIEPLEDEGLIQPRKHQT